VYEAELRHPFRRTRPFNVASANAVTCCAFRPEKGLAAPMLGGGRKGNPPPFCCAMSASCCCSRAYCWVRACVPAVSHMPVGRVVLDVC